MIFAVSLLAIFILFSIWNWKKLVDRIRNNSNVIRYYYNYYMFYFIIILCSVLLLPAMALRPKNIHNGKTFSYIIGLITSIFIKDIKFTMRNHQLLEKDQSAVIVANHQSTFDLLGLIMNWHMFDKLTVVTKKELLYYFPFGLCCYLCGVIFINRTNSKDAYKQLYTISKIMVKQKIKIFIYPEGTRNENAKDFLPFKKGAFNIAVAAQVPIVPIVHSPYYFIKQDQHTFNHGKIIIECLEPVPTVGLTLDDVPELAEQVRQKMREAYERLTKEVLID